MVKILNDSIRFLMELITVLLIIICGFELNGLIYKILIGILLPILIISYWSVYMAPKSDKRLSENKRLISEIIIFGIATGLIYFELNEFVASMYLTIIVINTILDHVLNRD